MNPFTPVHVARTYLGKWRAIRREVRTARFLDSLPGDLRKDIGWPESFDMRSARRR